MCTTIYCIFLTICIYSKPIGTRQCNHQSLCTSVLSDSMLCFEFLSLPFFCLCGCCCLINNNSLHRRLQAERMSTMQETQLQVNRIGRHREKNDSMILHAGDQNWQKLEYWLGPERARWRCELARTFDLRLEGRVLHNAGRSFLVVRSCKST
jgi:hypothetical protein